MPPQDAPQPAASPEANSHVRPVALAILATLIIVGSVLLAASSAGYIWFMPIMSMEYDTAAPDSGEVPEDLQQLIQGIEEIAKSGSSSIPVSFETDGTVTNISLSNGPVQEGVYSLTGSDPSGMSSYSGTVEIRHRVANVYDLMWRIGGSQEQSGVGIFHDGVLSVGYYDESGGTLQDVGAVSFVVRGGVLEGEWSSLQGGTTGAEKLQWLSH